MSYTVIVPKSVRKQILKLPDSVLDSVFSQLSDLQEDPRPPGSLKMLGSAGWRIRIGDYRIIYDIDDKGKTLIVRKVGHRREIYR